MNEENKYEYEKNIANIFNCNFNDSFKKCLYCNKIYNFKNIKEWRRITICFNMYHLSCYFNK